MNTLIEEQALSSILLDCNASVLITVPMLIPTDEEEQNGGEVQFHRGYRTISEPLDLDTVVDLSAGAYI